MEQVKIPMEQEQERLDKFLAGLYEGQGRSRSFFQRLIKEGQVLVDGIPQKPNFRLSAGEVVCISFPQPKELEILPQDIPLDILYEDRDLLVVNKPKGMVVHPSAGHPDHTLVNAVLYHCKDSLSGINGTLRPGIVHRIDKDTTGALLVCKNDAAHIWIAEQIKEHRVTRRYRGIVKGRVKEGRGTIDAPIGRHPVDRKKMAINHENGKQAITHYRVLESFEKHTYMEFELQTGRTHQIRVHMASIGHPLLGDEAYGGGKAGLQAKNLLLQAKDLLLQGQTLHAMAIGYIHPSTKEYQEHVAPLPDYFQKLLTKKL